MATPIPQPPAIPFLGNVTAIDKELPIRSFQLLAEKYGEIYQLNMLGMTLVIFRIVRNCLTLSLLII
jgi:cytochrome P450/NADPH-cytochrome P450 reductase